MVEETSASLLESPWRISVQKWGFRLRSRTRYVRALEFFVLLLPSRWSKVPIPDCSAPPYIILVEYSSMSYLGYVAGSSTWYIASVVTWYSTQQVEGYELDCTERGRLADYAVHDLVSATCNMTTSSMSLRE